MNLRVLWVAEILAAVLGTGVASGAQLVSPPLSHASGFQSVECHIVNAGKKDLVVHRFFIEDVNSSTSFGNTVGGPCSGIPPWTVPPGRGCSRSLIVTIACDQPNACFCLAEFSGSTKNVRGTLVGTVTGSTIALTADLR